MSELKQKVGSATAFTGISFHTLANTDGFVSTFVDNADASALGYREYRVEYKFRTGSSTPTNGTTVQFFLVTADDDGTQHVDGNLPFSTSSATEWTSSTSPHTASQVRDQLQFAHAQTVRNATATDYWGSFVVSVPASRNWAIYVYNESGTALDTTSGNHYMRYILSSIDVS